MAEVNPDVLIPPESPDEFHEDPGPRWPVILSYLLSAVIVALIVVFVGRTIYRSINDSSPKPHNPVVTTQTVKKPDVTTPSVTHSSNNTVPSQLPNNGPGNTIGLFAASSLAAGGLHYLVKRRRDA